MEQILVYILAALLLVVFVFFVVTFVLALCVTWNNFIKPEFQARRRRKKREIAGA